MDQMLLLGVLIVISGLLIGYAMWPRKENQQAKLRRRIRGQHSSDPSLPARPGGDSTAQRMLERVAPIAIKPVMPKNESEVSMLRIKLSNAGFRRENAPTLFLASKTVCGLGFGIVAVVLQMTGGKALAEVAVWMAGSGGVGFMLPNLWLYLATSQRGRKIREGLPDSMDLMVISVESGLALDAALQRVGEEMLNVHPELAEEFQIATHEGQMGIPRSEALNNMAIRTGVTEMKSLVAVVTQAEKFGTSVAKALRNQADALRVKRRQAAEEAAQKTTVKLMLPLMFFIFPAIFVVLVGPAVLRMIKTFGDM